MLGISDELVDIVDDVVERDDEVVRDVVGEEVEDDVDWLLDVKELVRGDTVELCEVELVDVDVLFCWFASAR